jgi:D-alanyl-D-alanine carboxypeptidase
MTHRRAIGSVVCVSALLAVTVVVALDFFGRSSLPADRQDRIGRALDALIATGVPGAVAFVRDGRRTILLARGVADTATQAPMRTTARFRVASITKTFVAAVVLQLVGEGRLSLDERVDDVAPGLLPRADAAITVRELLHHTSGLYDFASDWRWFWPYFHGNPGRRWAPRQLLAFALSHPRLFRPGSRWRYSNTNYVVLGLIVQAVTRQSIATELKDRLFVPLGLHDTTFEVGPESRPALAHGYTLIRSRNTDVTRLSPSAWWAAGAIVSTAADVAHFYRALLRGIILPRRLMAAMESVIPTGEPGGGDGLGIFRTRLIAKLGPSFAVRCGAGWGHSGQIDGYLTAALANRDASRQYVILVNEDPSAFPPGAPSAIAAVANTAFC